MLPQQYVAPKGFEGKKTSDNKVLILLAGIFSVALNLGGDALLVTMIQMQNLVFLNSFQLTYPVNA